jgi:hypothetical protein
MSKLTSVTVWVCLILCLKASGGQHVLKLGFVYDPYGPFSNALLGYDFYAHKINSAGGLAVGMNGTTYQIKIVKHSNNNRTDPFWRTSGSREYPNSGSRAFSSESNNFDSLALLGLIVLLID